MRINWADVNWTDQPGVHELADGRHVQVSAVEIARWRSCPEGAFDTYWYPGTSYRAAQFTLTDFHPAPAPDQPGTCLATEAAA